MEAFHLSQCMKSMAARIVQGIKALSRPVQSDGDEDINMPRLPRDSIKDLTIIYCKFENTKVTMPDWLRSPEEAIAPSPSDDDKTRKACEYQVETFLAQKAHFLLSLHCLRLVIHYHCVNSGLPLILGAHMDSHDISLRGLNVGARFVQVLVEAPFRSIKSIAVSTLPPTNQTVRR
ncbi:hypothetical protein BDW69DRAFT_190414 [Aspergillus filifer]